MKRVPYEEMVAQFARVLEKKGSLPPTRRMPPSSLPRTVWPVCSATV